MQSLEQTVTEALDLPDDATLGERFAALSEALRLLAAEVDALAESGPTDASG